MLGNVRLMPDWVENLVVAQSLNGLKWKKNIEFKL